MGYGRCHLSSVIAVAYAILLIFIGKSSCLKIIGVTVPVLADLRHPVTLDCTYDMEEDTLFSTKWYIGDKEFYRYMPNHWPNSMQFVTPNYFVAKQKRCDKHHCEMTLTELQPLATGAYTCEVSSEAPKFRTVSETRNMTVAVLPTEAPKIEGLKASYDVGDRLEVLCKTAPSFPKPIIEVLVNNKQLPEKALTDYYDPVPVKLFTASARVVLVLTRDHFVPMKDDPNVSIIKFTCSSHLRGIPASMSKTEAIANLAGPTMLTNQKLAWPVVSSGSSDRGGFSHVQKIVIGIILLLVMVKVK